MTAKPRKKPRKARRWTLCVNDGRFKSYYGPERVGAVWGDAKGRPHFKAPHEHVRVVEVLPKRRKK